MIQAIAIIVLGTMVAINTAEIGHRVFYTNSLNWVQELSLVLAMTLYFLVYALIAKRQEYIRINLANSWPNTDTLSSNRWMEWAADPYLSSSRPTIMPT